MLPRSGRGVGPNHSLVIYGATHMSLNKVQIIGRLGDDPELRYTGSGTAVANLSIATDESYTQDGNEVEQTEWHDVTCWAGLAETVAEYLEKGRRVYVEGKLKTREWEDKNGNTRYSTEIHADRVDFLGGERRGQQMQRQEPSNGTPQAQEPASAGQERTSQEQESFEPDDDLPF
jgi:single-strand DNA-binding protein